MRVFISADIEGCTGLVTWGQSGGPRAAHFDWEFARRMMTHDVNAAIRGCREAGATSVLVKDSHNTSKNLLVDHLEPGVELISGFAWADDGMMNGVDASCTAAVLVGYHAMAGTIHGVMEHTYTGTVHGFSVNGRPAGEQLLSFATAGRHGVPVVAVTSDESGCREASALEPKVSTSTTKIGLGRYMARLRHPSETGPAIAAAVCKGCRAASKIPPFVLEPPFELQIELNRSEEADAVARLAGWERLDAFALRGVWPDWSAAHGAALSAFDASTRGIAANE